MGEEDPAADEVDGVAAASSGDAGGRAFGTGAATESGRAASEGQGWRRLMSWRNG